MEIHHGTEPSHGQEPRGRAERSPVQEHQLPAEPLHLLGSRFAAIPSPTSSQGGEGDPKEKELYSVARNKVVTNPRTRSTPRKVKDVMTHGETQNVARSTLCRRMKTNLKEQYMAPKVPNRPSEPPSPGKASNPSGDSPAWRQEAGPMAVLAGQE